MGFTAGFFIGTFLGVIIGVSIVSLMVAARNNTGIDGEIDGR